MFFLFSQRATRCPLTKKTEDSGYEIAFTLNRHSGVMCKKRVASSLKCCFVYNSLSRSEHFYVYLLLSTIISNCCRLMLGLDAVLHMSRITFKFWPTQINLGLPIFKPAELKLQNAVRIYQFFSKLCS